jgi:hypothetical protein
VEENFELMYVILAGGDFFAQQFHLFRDRHSGPRFCHDTLPITVVTKAATPEESGFRGHGRRWAPGRQNVLSPHSQNALEFIS